MSRFVPLLVLLGALLATPAHGQPAVADMGVQRVAVVHLGFEGDVPDFVGIGLMSDGDQTNSVSAADYAGFVLEH